MAVTTDTPRSTWRRAYRGTAALLALLVLVQAVIAGQATFGQWDIEVHGWLGNGTFAVGLVLLGLAIVTKPDRIGLAVVVALVVAMFAQIGLGYAGRTAAAAAAWHVPLGVTIFGLAIYNLSLSYRPTTANVGARRT